MMWLAFGLGLLLGTVAGIFVIGLFHIGARSRAYEEFPDRGPCRLESLGHPAFADEVN